MGTLFGTLLSSLVGGFVSAMSGGGGARTNTPKKERPNPEYQAMGAQPGASARTQLTDPGARTAMQDPSVRLATISKFRQSIGA